MSVYRITFIVGTTWTQEMIWLLTNNIDFEKANSTYLHLRFPFLE